MSGLTLQSGYPSDGGRRSFLPDDLPDCLCEPVVPMFEGGLREVTTDNIETSLCFDGLKYGGLLEMADCVDSDIDVEFPKTWMHARTEQRMTTQAHEGTIMLANHTGKTLGMSLPWFKQVRQVPDRLLLC